MKMIRYNTAFDSKALCATWALLALAMFVPVALAQDASAKTNDTQAQPTESEPAPVDASKKSQDNPDSPTVPSAIVIEVAGSADWAIPGTSPIVADGWTTIATGDELKPGTLIRTGLRSHVNLQFGETTTVSVRSASYASIDQFFRSATTETVRVGLGYGTVRGGSSEGEIRADVEVTAPVATLAKRGTEGWEIDVERGTGRFRISLAEHGLVQAIKSASGKRTVSRQVKPGQYATNTNIANMWINQNIFDRNVSFYDAGSITDADAAFLTTNTGNFATIAPGGGSALADVSGRSNRGFVLGIQQGGRFRSQLPLLPIGVSGPISRPEGNFGTGGIFKRR
jgi:hypothetical protein